MEVVAAAEVEEVVETVIVEVVEWVRDDDQDQEAAVEKDDPGLEEVLLTEVCHGLAGKSYTTQ